MAKKVFIASDHAGFCLKQILVRHLQEKGHDVFDLGPEQAVSCDYPDSAFKVTDKLLENEGAFGILICGTGIGMSMAANKVKGIRAALAACEFHARACREHNNANILCLGERVTGAGLAVNLADIFLETEFLEGRHLRRIELFNMK
ncbi:MAG TPA: ribose 5-phosphate isomerase B [Desulfovibrio sp.]|nr:ribose 5-phosphate isomerase B [Desulfovibrio sp.]